MSNSVGTHVGYCAFLGKPHYVYNQDKRYTAVASVDAAEFNNPYRRLAEQEKAEVVLAFNPFEKNQKSIDDVCNYYWGFHNVLTDSQMAELVDLCNQAYEISPKRRQSYFRETLSSTSLGGLIG